MTDTTFTKEDIERGYQSYLSKRYDNPFICFTGKKGKIAYETAFMEKCGCSEEYVCTAKELLEQTLTNKLYKLGE